MSRQTPTSRRSPSILVTDVRHSKAHSAPFVSRRLNSVSVDSLLSNTSEVPSAQRRVAPQRFSGLASTSNYGTSSHRSPMARKSRRAETMPLLAQGSADPGADQNSRFSPPFNSSSFNSPSFNVPSFNSSSFNSSSLSSPSYGRPAQTGTGSYGSDSFTSELRGSTQEPSMRKLAKKQKPLPMKPVPQLSKPLPSRTSKQSQRLVLIPDSEEGTSTLDHDLDVHSHTDRDDTMRVTSYLVAEGIILPKVAKFLKEKHRARLRRYDEALFADYLLPLLPGNGIDYRIQSSKGDDKSMERMIDISEQRDHHFEYFAAAETSENDSSEPQDFSPRPNDDAPIRAVTEQGSSKSADTSLNGDNQADNVDGSGHKKSHEHTHDHSSTSDKHDDSHDENARKELENKRKLDRFTSHAEVFVFNYGVVVFWNFTEAQEKQILADLCIGSEDLTISAYSDQEIQSEELRFVYNLNDNEKPQVFNDVITLNSNSHMLKLAMSHAMAQSTILCGFEDRMQANLKDVRTVPKTLALTGKLGMNREQLLKISGRLFKLRVDVNLSSNVLDIPDFFWDSEPSLFPLFNALREYLEIEERVLVLNERQSVFLELTSILGDSIAEFNMDRITVIVICLIVLSILVSLTEIAVRFLVLRRLEK